MTTRLNTIEVPFDMNLSTLAAATRFDFTTETIYMPENTTRTFKSVHVEVTFMQNNTVATNMTSLLIGIKLGATAFNDVTVTQTFTNSGEINGFGPFKRDVTSYFNTNFGTGTSQTCQVGITVGGASTINHSAKLVITYEYDDADTTRIKLVRIPIESATGNLTTSYVEIGTDQIPALTSGGLLPEASVNIRKIWFEVEANTNASGTTDTQHGLRLDAGGSDDLTGLIEGFANASMYMRRIWRPTISDTTVTHKIYSRVTNTTLRFAHQAIMMYVLYEYDASTTTTVLQSVMLGFGGRYGPNAASTDLERFPVHFLCNEPATVTLKQSGVYLTWLGNGGATISVAVGGQTARGYTHSASTVDQSGYFLCHRLDSGGAAGAGHTLARGVNNIVVDIYSSSTSSRCMDGFVILNYTSGVASTGIATHNKTTRWLAREWGTAVAAVQQMSAALNLPAIPESDYYLSNWVVVSDLVSAASATARESYMIIMQQQSGEQDGAGWNFSYSSPIVFDTEIQTGGIRFVGRIQPEWILRYPGDPQNGMNVETSRKMLSILGFSAIHHVEQYITTNNITFTKSGTVSNYSGAGTGLTVKYFKSSNGTYVGSSTTTTGGAHSFTWYDDADPLFAVVLQDSSHCGASYTG